MNKKLSALVLSGLLVFTAPLLSAMNCPFPLNQVIFTPPGEANTRWKQITHVIDDRVEMFEYCPPNQKAESWSELICVTCFYISNLNIKSIDELLTISKNAAPTGTTWNCIEKDKDSAIYESIFTVKHNGRSPQHEIVRTFFKGSTVYDVRFTKRDEKITPAEKEEWVKLLKENAIVFSTSRK